MADEKSTSNKKKKVGLIAGICAAVVVVAAIAVIIILNMTPKIVGKYEFSATISDGQESTEMVDFMKALGGTQTIEFKKDKTGELRQSAGDAESTFTFTYTDDELKMKYDDDDDETITYKLEYKDDVVTMTVDNDGMKFTRIKE